MFISQIFSLLQSQHDIPEKAERFVDRNAASYESFMSDSGTCYTNDKPKEKELFRMTSFSRKTSSEKKLLATLTLY